MERRASIDITANSAILREWAERATALIPPSVKVEYVIGKEYENTYHLSVITPPIKTEKVTDKKLLNNMKSWSDDIRKLFPKELNHTHAEGIWKNEGYHFQIWF